MIERHAASVYLTAAIALVAVASSLAGGTATASRAAGLQPKARFATPLTGSRLVWTRAQFLARWRLLGRRALGFADV